VTAGTGCSQVTAGEALCATDPLTFGDVEIVLDDLDDFASISTFPYGMAHLDGGDGGDKLEVGFGANENIFDGGPGADTFRAAVASDGNFTTTPTGPRP
jgi:hypothetical protein